MKNIIVTGSLAYDYIMHFPGKYEENILPDKIKSLSVSFLVDKFSKNFGGVSGNIAHNLGLFHQKSTILTSVGKDFSEYEKYLNSNGIDLSNINYVPNEFTANAFIITDQKNNQITGFHPGAMEKDPTLTLEDITGDFLIIAPTIPEAMGKFVKEAKQKGLPYLYDPAQQIPRLSTAELKEAIDGAEILIGNDYEISLILEKTGLSKAALLTQLKILVTTLGAKGSQIETKDNSLKIGIVAVKRIADPTGAGDAYIAGFIYGYVNNLPLKTCGQLGATAASFAIESTNTQAGFTLSAFKDRYSQTFKEMIDLKN